jgi:hypothetical protein
MEILCHYTKAETAKNILSSQSLWLGNLAMSNDPIEIKNINFEYSGDDQDTWQIVQNELRGYLNRILHYICFSKGSFPFDDESYLEEHSGFLHDCADRPPFYLPRTWHIYGQSCSGVCFVFNRSKLIQQIEKQLKLSYHCIEGEIEYIDLLKNEVMHEVADSHIFSEEEIRKHKPNQTIQRFLSEYSNLNYFKKDIDWRDEREYRVLCWRRIDDVKDTQIMLNIRDSIVAIILGLKNDSKDIIEIAKDSGIRAYQLQYDEHIRLLEL